MLNLTSKLLTISSALYPEKDKAFEYLLLYLKYAKIEDIFSKGKIEELQKEEKIFHDMIMNYNQYNITSLKAWENYIDWVGKLIPKTENDQIRRFIVLESFTKSMIAEKNYYNNQTYISYWVYYMDMCADDIEIISYMKRNGICTQNFFLYESMAIVYEKFHDFHSANANYLEGMDKKVDNLDSLQMKYKQFEIRMENRINRELRGTELSSQEINDLIHNEINKLNAPMFNDNKKRIRKDACTINCNFIIRKGRFEFIEQTNSRFSNDEDIQPSPTVKYGQIPVFIDAPFRKNFITKGSQLVEIYSILVKYLLENDKKFITYNENFIKSLKEEYANKPLSWLSSKRIIPARIQNIANEEIDKQNLQAPVKIQMIAENNKQQTSQQCTEVLGEDGQKIRLVKIPENNCKKIVTNFRKTSINESLTEKRIRYYLQKEKDKLKKRKTILCKIDADGDVCMSSDEECEVENIKGQGQPKSIEQPKITDKEKKVAIIPSNINLFEYPMTCEEINEKIKEVSLNFSQGKISIETRDRLYSYLEEKIIQLEKARAGKLPAQEIKMLGQGRNEKKQKEDEICPKVSRGLDFGDSNKKVNSILTCLDKQGSIKYPSGRDEFSISFDSAHSRSEISNPFEVGGFLGEGSQSLDDTTPVQNSAIFAEVFKVKETPKLIMKDSYVETKPKDANRDIVSIFNVSKRKPQVEGEIHLLLDNGKCDDYFTKSKLSQLFSQDLGRNNMKSITENNNVSCGNKNNNNNNKNVIFNPFLMSSITEKTGENASDDSISFGTMFK